MNSNIDAASLQPSLVETWNPESDAYQPHSLSKSNNEGQREAVALFPAGRFFRFPVRVRIRLASECSEESSRRLNGNDFYPAIEHLRTEVFSMVWALIENASCIDRDQPLPDIFFFGDVVVDFRKMELRRGRKRIEATPLEFRTLHYFVTHPEVPISRDELLNHVWGYCDYPATRTVDNRIMQLRKKVESDPARPIHVLTVHGVGYKFVP